MIARVAQFEGINVEAAERTGEQALTILAPILDRLAGHQGSLELVSPDGKAISISLFDSEENARAAESTFDQEMPEKLGELFKDWEGRRVSVQHYRVLADFSRLATV